MEIVSNPGTEAAAAAAPQAAGADQPLEIRNYRSGDEARIIDLFERVFGRTMGRTESARHWKWEFLDTPAGYQAILLAFAGSTLAAQYAVMPLRVHVDGALMHGALSLDTATDKAFRGRGIFPRLANQLYSELGQKGSFAVFGFPNAMSAPTFFKKLGWVELAPFPLLVKPLRGAVRAQLSRRGALGRIAAPFAEFVWSIARRPPRRIPAALSAEEVKAFPPDTDQLWARARHGKRICVVRDRRYLQWRYFENPDSVYRVWTLREAGTLVGALVTRVEERFSMMSGFVLDIVCEESRPDVASALVSLAETSMAGEGAQMVTALMYPSSIVRRAIDGAGFIAPPRRLMPQEIYFGARALADTTDKPMLYDSRNWYVTWGDSDVV
jgi:GNAT superfamily N-acetyltransferase